MNSAMLFLLALIALCSAHVHIMEPHQEVSDVKSGTSIIIKCESTHDHDIKWLHNHKPVTAGGKISIADTHETYTDEHAHLDGDAHDHKNDDDIDKVLHEAHAGHTDDHEDGGHSHSHGDDAHDHKHEGSHDTPTGNHTAHHRISTLTVTAATETDAGTYSCYEHDNKEKHDDIHITVGQKWGAERISLEHESTDHVHVGGTIVLVCNYYGIKTNANITWKKGGVAASSDFDTKQIPKPYGVKGMLHKDKAVLADSGNYTCIVDNLSDNVKVSVASSSGALVPTACLLTLAAIFATVKLWI